MLVFLALRHGCDNTGRGGAGGGVRAGTMGDLHRHLCKDLERSMADAPGQLLLFTTQLGHGDPSSGPAELPSIHLSVERQ